jgi:hypothetical protein
MRPDTVAPWSRKRPATGCVEARLEQEEMVVTGRV